VSLDLLVTSLEARDELGARILLRGLFSESRDRLVLHDARTRSLCELVPPSLTSPLGEQTERQGLRLCGRPSFLSSL
jgi:hypothetical protein